MYYVSPAGKVSRVAEGIERPNGVMLSPDEKTLYVNNTNGEYLLAFEVKPDGSVGARRNFAKYSKVTDDAGRRVHQRRRRPGHRRAGPASMRATAAGVEVFSPQGQTLGVIPVSLAPQNIAFAGADKKTLYIVGRGAAFKVRLLTRRLRRPRQVAVSARARRRRCRPRGSAAPSRAARPTATKTCRWPSRAHRRRP